MALILMLLVELPDGAALASSGRRLAHCTPRAGGDAPAARIRRLRARLLLEPVDRRVQRRNLAHISACLYLRERHLRRVKTDPKCCP